MISVAAIKLGVLESTTSNTQFRAPSVIVLGRFEEVLPQERITEEENILPRFRTNETERGAGENITFKNSLIFPSHWVSQRNHVTFPSGS